MITRESHQDVVSRAIADVTGESTNAPDARLQEILAMPEALGRRPLACYLAGETTVPVEQVRIALASSHSDLAGDLATAAVKTFREQRASRRA